MFNNIIRIRPSLLLLRNQRAAYIRGYWPEPITQQNLSQFLEEINYFEHPKEFINIGLKLSKVQTPKLPKTNLIDTAAEIEIKPEKVDELLGLLSHEPDAPPLDYDDVRLQGKDLISLAISSGVFRDLFGDDYIPERGDIKFTQEQAERLDKLIPDYWITDQPFARVDHSVKDTKPLPYFEPVIGISARFIQQQTSNDEKVLDNDIYAHTSYYGNIIPASEALSKPSITLDCRILSDKDSNECLKESDFRNWTPGSVEFANCGNMPSRYYSIILVNLDHLHENSSNLHWMLTNIDSSDTSNTSKYEEVCDYLPVHGIKGFGYSRYVFVVFQHDSKLDTSDLKIEGFTLESRKFDVKSFISKHKNSGITPVGLSWFQTTWDITSNKIFHDYFDMKCPVYDHVQTKDEKIESKAYPGRIPFNIYLDYERDKKDINKQVLLERLQSVDPFDYKDQFVPPRVPLTVFSEEKRHPDWMKNVLFKKKNKIGYWRGLRPASAVLPLDNNADLDYPLRPVESSRKGLPERPNDYPGGTHQNRSARPVSTKEMESKDQSVFIQEDHEVHLDEVMKIMKDFESKKDKSKSSKKSSSSS